MSCKRTRELSKRYDRKLYNNMADVNARVKEVDFDFTLAKSALFLPPVYVINSCSLSKNVINSCNPYNCSPKIVIHVFL